MAPKDYSVASASALRGSVLVGPREAKLLQQQMEDMDQAKDKNQTKRQSGVRRSVRFTPSTNFNDNSTSEASPDTDIFTQSPHASRSSVASIDFADSLPEVRVAREASIQVLKPVVYSPPQDSANLLLPTTTYSPSPVTVKQRVEEFEALPEHIVSTELDRLRLDTDDLGHKRSPSGSSTSSGRRRKDDIYFTPVDVTRSSIYLASPVGSPSAISDSPTLPQDLDDEDQCATPRAPKAFSRPSSEIYVGGFNRSKTNKNVLRISPAQLDQLVVALAKSRMLQKHVQGDSWMEDFPDDDSSQVSLPTLTSASSLYSQQNDNFLNEHRNAVTRKAILEEEFAQHYPDHPKANSSKSAPTVTLGGVALCDAKIHGSPVRFVSKHYRHSGSILGVGTCTYLSVPYGTEVESTLRIETPSSISAGTRVLVQCKTQVVDRKTGKQAYALMAEEDVTDHFIKAVLAELSEASGKSLNDIEVADAPKKLPRESTEIDWVEVADELQLKADTTDIVDDTATILRKLESETACMQTSTLMSSLDDIKEKYEDCLVFRPTSFFDNGVPSNMRLPWVSQRLFTDWYDSEKSLGYSEAAKDFQACIVANIAKHATAKKAFDCEAYWGTGTKQSIHCVPLMETTEGHCDAWVCFVRGPDGVDT